MAAGDIEVGPDLFDDAVSGRIGGDQPRTRREAKEAQRAEDDEIPSDLGPQHGREPYNARHRRLEEPLLAEGQKPKDGGTVRFIRDLVVVAVVAFLLSMAMKTWLIRPYFIPSASMSQTLVEDDRVLVNLLVPDVVPVERGQVIVFKDPGGWLPSNAPTAIEEKTPLDRLLESMGVGSEQTQGTLIKRVIGLPGDRVKCCDDQGRLIINDVPITEPYIQTVQGEPASGVEFDVTVPADALWVMGDNRYNSQDSRFHQDLPTKGFVPMSQVIGHAFMINLPLDRIGILDSYPDVYAQVPSREP